MNPIAGYEKPAATPRVTAFTPEEEQLLYKHANKAFGQFKPVSIEVLAGLLGNAPAAAWRHYTAWSNEYNDPLWEALGERKPKVA